MRRTACLCAFLVTLWLCGRIVAPSTTQQLLRQADEARGNLDGVIWEVVLESVERARTETMSFEVKARGFDILGETLAPPRSKGNKILMLSGNMWFYKPGLSKPVPISRRQRLLGNAAYGDIAATNYAHDYTATPLADDTINGEPCYVFDLKSRDNRTTYARIQYWISKARGVGVKAEYFTVSGKRLKSASMEYSNSVHINGEARPFLSRIVIEDAWMSSDITTLLLRHPRLQPLPQSIFDLNLLLK